MRGTDVNCRIDGNGVNTKGAAGLDDAEGNLSAIGDKNLGKGWILQGVLFPGWIDG
jgi:hypothetical protein